MIVREGRLHAAGCFLPLSDNQEISRELGTRHRAALGMSEMSDAIVVVVSEETGFITVCRNGKLERGLSTARLREYLEAELTPEKPPPSLPTSVLTASGGKKEPRRGKIRMKFNFGRLLDNRRLLMILSLVTSVIIWLVIVYYVEPDKVQTIRNVPVTITADQVDALAALNLAHRRQRDRNGRRAHRGARAPSSAR